MAGVRSCIFAHDRRRRPRCRARRRGEAPRLQRDDMGFGSRMRRPSHSKRPKRRPAGSADRPKRDHSGPVQRNIPGRQAVSLEPEHDGVSQRAFESRRPDFLGGNRDIGRRREAINQPKPQWTLRSNATIHRLDHCMARFIPRPSDFPNSAPPAQAHPARSEVQARRDVKVDTSWRTPWPRGCVSSAMLRVAAFGLRRRSCIPGADPWTRQP